MSSVRYAQSGSSLALLKKIEAGLRATGRQGREYVATEAFGVYLSPSSHEHLNLAVPHEHEYDHDYDVEQRTWAAGIDEMLAVFAANERQPRLEYIGELHPHLAAALDDAGFQRDSVAPVMVLTSPAPVTTALPVATYRQLGSERVTVERFLRAQQRAFFGDEEGGMAWLEPLLSGLHDTTITGAALWHDDTPICGAVIQRGGEVGELVGVYTLPEWRRRGLAFALLQRLLADDVAAGHTFCWLSAAEGAERLYETLGFVRIGTQHNASWPRRT